MENVPREILTGKSEGLKGELSPHMRCRIEWSFYTEAGPSSMNPIVK